MQGLRADQLRAVLTLGHELAELTEFAHLGSMLGRLARLVGSDTATLTHLNVHTGREVALLWPAERVGRAGLHAYGAVGHTHPLRRALVRELPRRAGQRAVPRVSDLLSRAQWRTHPVRAAMPDVTDQMAVLLAGRHPVIHAVTLGRLGGVFDDDQRDLLTAAGPLLAAPLARASRAGHRALQLAPRPLWVPAGSAPAVADPGRVAPDLTATPSDALPLSQRELEVLQLVAEGATDAQVARALGLRPATVSKHLTRIYARLGVPNRAAAVRRLTVRPPGTSGGAC